MNKELFINKVSKIDQTFEDEFKSDFNSPELLWDNFLSSRIFLPYIKSGDSQNNATLNLECSDLGKGRYKVNVEVHSPGDGRLFLNYWNWRNGNDVTCEVIDGKLIHNNEVDGEEKHDEVTLSEFLTMVEARVT